MARFGFFRCLFVRSAFEGSTLACLEWAPENSSNNLSEANVFDYFCMYVYITRTSFFVQE